MLGKQRLREASVQRVVNGGLCNCQILALKETKGKVGFSFRMGEKFLLQDLCISGFWDSRL